MIQSFAATSVARKVEQNLATLAAIFGRFFWIRALVEKSLNVQSLRLQVHFCEFS